MHETQRGDALDVRIVGLTKIFGAVRANSGINLHLKPGTIHGLVGENGAGKSTTMKMLYGLYAPDAGEIVVNGTARTFKSPTDAIGAGIGMVHQHFMLAEPYSVLDNIILGAEPVQKFPKVFPRNFPRIFPRALCPINRRQAAERITKVTAQYGLDVPLDARVASLPVGIQQRIEIIKLLYRHARLLILDEPTAVLTPLETRELFANLRRLRAEGHSVVIITHKLEEVMAITDEVSVMRAGKMVGKVETNATSVEELAALMVGREVNLRIPVKPAAPRNDSVFEARNYTLRRAKAGPDERSVVLDDLNLRVRAGEVVGVAGVEGNGQREFFEAMVGTLSAGAGGKKGYRIAGHINVLSTPITHASSSEVRSLEIGIIPYDRHREGLLLTHDSRENCMLGYQRRPEASRRGFLRMRALAATSASIFETFDVRPRDTMLEAKAFSGGNQQKIIVGRELSRNPRFVVAANPIRGVDVGAIEFIHTQLIAARDRGAGVLLFSSDLDEIMTLSDRIVVMYEGRIVGEFSRGACTIEQLGMLMGGGGGDKRHG